MLSKLLPATVAALTLATTPLATAGAYAASAGSFSSQDVPQIVQASDWNEIRFNRDYRDQAFDATLPLAEIAEISWRKGEYRVSFSVSDDYGVDCIVSDQAVLDRMVNWNKGRKVEVSGSIGKAVIGDLQLNNCVFKDPPVQPASAEPEHKPALNAAKLVAPRR
jgi:hypothetical protein